MFITFPLLDTISKRFGTENEQIPNSFLIFVRILKN